MSTNQQLNELSRTSSLKEKHFSRTEQSGKQSLVTERPLELRKSFVAVDPLSLTMASFSSRIQTMQSALTASV
jgi:hypothetical protein